MYSASYFFFIIIQTKFWADAGSTEKCVCVKFCVRCVADTRGSEREVKFFKKRLRFQFGNVMGLYFSAMVCVYFLLEQGAHSP